MPDSIEIDFSDDELLRYAVMAHNEGITLNQWITNVLIGRVAKEQDDLIQALQEEIVELKEEGRAYCGDCISDPLLGPITATDMQGFPI